LLLQLEPVIRSNRFSEPLASPPSSLCCRGFRWIVDVLKRGASRSGQPVGDLIISLDASPEQQELLIKALELARSRSLAAKRGAIAEALAHGSTSSGAAISETDFLRLIEDLDVAHFEALRVLGEARDVHLMPRPAGTISPWHYEVDDIGKINPKLKGQEHRLLAVLAGHGLAAQHDEESFHIIRGCWSITSAGIELLPRFEAVEGEG
jgi:hypothetical protein